MKVGQLKGILNEIPEDATVTIHVATLHGELGMPTGEALYQVHARDLAIHCNIPEGWLLIEDPGFGMGPPMGEL